MENVRATYDLFVQNQLKRTSHTLEWLDMSQPCKDNSMFNWEYFLLGTHREEQDPGTDQLQLTRIRVPNRSLTLDELQGMAKK